MGIHFGEPEVARWKDTDLSTARTSEEPVGSSLSSISSLGVDYIGPCIIKATHVASAAKGGQILLSSAATEEVLQKGHEELSQLGKLHRAVQLQGMAQSEDLFDFAIKGLERQFADVHISTVSEFPHNAQGDFEDFTWRSQTVAVKKFFRQKVDSVTVTEIELQIKEIVTLSDIRHPNIVLFMGACTEPHNMFIVTEWMDMGNLLQLISSSHQLEKQRGIAILTSTCSALTYLHKCSIVHRDLKSSNILLNENMEVKVSDFGMEAVKTANKISTLCGTIAWMAPEVLSSARYSEASDVYSFGIVMSEILSGEVPFKGLNKVVVAREILQGKRPDIPIVQGLWVCVADEAAAAQALAHLRDLGSVAGLPLFQSSAPQLIVATLEAHPGSVPVAVSALGAMASVCVPLARSDQMSSPALYASLARAALGVMQAHPQSPPVQRAGCEALARMACSLPAVLDECVALGAVEGVLSALSLGLEPPELPAAACDALLAFCAGSSSARQLVVRLGAVDVLVGLVEPWLPLERRVRSHVFSLRSR
eukprot:m51a1_g12081 putative serine threonine kinase (537) ;mRNA; f:3007-5389